MSAPLLWIFFPILAGMILWLFRAKHFFVAALVTSICLLLSLLAWLFPIGDLIRIGPLTIEITPILTVFGRRFVLQEGDRFLLIFFYALGAFWFFGEAILRKNRNFAPLGLTIVALAISTVAVEPFLYAALIMQIIVLISIPLLVPAGANVGQGVLRFLVFQTLGMMLILFAGWAAAGVEANPNDAQLTSQALIFLGLGFAFWLAVFPFHTWIPLLASEVFPYQTGFLLSLLPQAMLLLALDFLNGFAWLRQFPALSNMLQVLGLIMVTAGGVWSAFQRDLSRLFGFAVIIGTGFSLLALSLETRTGYEIYVSLFLPRVMSLLVFAMALSNMDEKAYHFDDIKGWIRKKPVVTITLLTALFSISGLPLLAEFPLRQVLMENLAQRSTQVIIWILIGSLGWLAASIRTLLVVTGSSSDGWQWSEDWRVVVLLLIGALALFLLGIMPQWFVSSMKNLLIAFENLI